MRLVLETRRGPTGAALERREIDGGAFRIGRGGESDWILADPERVLSKCHCQLVACPDGWTVFDTSSNGTMLNGSPLKPGVRAALRDGDRLVLGSYEIEVHAVPAAGALGHDAPERCSTEDPFPFPGTDEFGFLLPEADPRSSFEPVGVYAAGASLSDLHADRASDLNEHIRLPRPTSDLLPADWDTPDLDVPDLDKPDLDVPGVDARAWEPPVSEAPAAPVGWAPPLPSAGLASTQASPAPLLAAFRSDAGTEAAAAGFAAFAAGARMEGATVADPLATLHALGDAFHALVHELRQTMMARAAIKTEFRIEQTMIRPAGNNPLKFAVDDADALSALLGTGRRTGMTPRQAVAGAVRDIRLHELAVMTAMQQAARDMLGELAPERLEEEVASAPFDAVAGRREVRLWRAFRTRHERASRALRDDFDSAFGRSFMRAYEVVLRQAEDAEPADQAASEGDRP